MTSIELVRLDQLVDDPDNPRVDVGDVTALATSIKNLGLQQALRVRKLEDGTFAVVAGSRRHAAMKQAKLPSDYIVPCTVTTDNGSSSTLTGLVENAQRENLNRWEQADAFNRLVTEFGMKQKQIAELTGFDPSLVSRRVAIAKLSQVARDTIDICIATSSRYDDDDIVDLGRNHSKVPDEVWSVIKSWSDVNRMRRAQEMLAAREQVAKVLTIEDPQVCDHDSVVVPEGHRLVEHQDRSANDLADIEVGTGDAGVMRRFFSWVPFGFEPIDPVVEEAEKEAARDGRAEQREAKRRANVAAQHWFEQWWAVLSKATPAQARDIVVAAVVREAKAGYPSHWVEARGIRVIGDTIGWEIPEKSSNHALRWDAEMNGKDALRLLAFALVVRYSSASYLTGDPADAKPLLLNTVWLDDLRKEFKVTVPRVK